MSDRATSLAPLPRIIEMAIAVGVLCAALLGIWPTSSSSSNAPEAKSVQVVYEPGLAFLGFLFGTPIGGAIGKLWGRKGLGGVIGFILVALVGGFAGLVAATLLGAEARVTVSDNSVASEYGVPVAVMISGACLGLVMGALIAWWFGYPARTATRPPLVPAAPGTSTGCGA